MRRFRRSRHGQFVAVVIVVLLALVRWQGWLADSARRPIGSVGLEPGGYEVERVVDGDTLIVRGRRRVRLQGVDTRETVKEGTAVQRWGPEATAFTKSFVGAAGGRVRIDVDGEAVDQFGRYLAFVWHDGRMLNEELVRAGLAKAMLQYEYSQAKKDRLRRAQQDAQHAGRGIWSEASPSPR
jgi:micrococcal nuclease